MPRKKRRPPARQQERPPFEPFKPEQNEAMYMLFAHGRRQQGPVYGVLRLVEGAAQHAAADGAVGAVVYSSHRKYKH
jgi:hypothetical protein